MQFKDFRKSGTFRLGSGEEVQGDLSLNGRTTKLDLYSSTPFDASAGGRDIFGTFHDRSKVSLINCITTSGPGIGWRGKEQHYFASIFPHYAAFGDQHISSLDRKITEVSFTVDDAPSIFHDFDTFGSVTDAYPHMKRIAEATERAQPIKFGEFPEIFYFNGKHEVFAVDTALGRVSARHGIAYRRPSPEGIQVKNTIRLCVSFATDQSIEDVTAAVMDALRFLEVIAGRTQNVGKLTFRLSDKEDKAPQILDTYWSLPPSRVSEEGTGVPDHFDLPLQAGTNPEQFGGVLVHWLERNAEWRNARARYAAAMAHQNRYGIDRLVGAANMFDLLPASACPAVFQLAPDVEKAKDDARRMFRDLSPSPERDSVLNALGRIGKATLKRKIRSRIKLITDAVGDLFPELDFVADQAVDCRNYYVHGTPTKIDYGKHDDQVSFFTDTLEFVFAASDLAESGWAIGSHFRNVTTMSHPFGRYRASYSSQLEELKRLL